MTLQTVISNSIADNSINISKLDVADGNAGEFLQTNGSGILSFATAASTLSSGGTGIRGITVINDLEFEGSDANRNDEQTYTVPTGVNSIMYFLQGSGESGQTGQGPANGRGGGSGATVWGFLDVANITSIVCRVGTPALQNGSIAGIPQFSGSSFNSYFGDLVGVANDGNIATDTNNSELMRGTHATCIRGNQTNVAGTGFGGVLRLINQLDNTFFPSLGRGGTRGQGRNTNDGLRNSPGSRGERGMLLICEFA
jgi:hypothetical protein